MLSFFTRKKITSKNCFSKGHESTRTGQPEQIHTDTQPYLVSAIFVAITIFLTPGGGLLKTWVRGRDEIRYLILKKGIKTGSGNQAKQSTNLRLINGRHEGVQGNDDESVWNPTGQRDREKVYFCDYLCNITWFTANYNILTFNVFMEWLCWYRLSQSHKSKCKSKPKNFLSIN